MEFPRQESWSGLPFPSPLHVLSHLVRSHSVRFSQHINHFHTRYCKSFSANLPAGKSQLYPWENWSSEQARGHCLRSQSLETADSMPRHSSPMADLMTDSDRISHPLEQGNGVDNLISFCTLQLVWKRTFCPGSFLWFLPTITLWSPKRPLLCLWVMQLFQINPQIESQWSPDPAREAASRSHALWCPEATGQVMGCLWACWSQHKSAALWSSENSEDTSLCLHEFQASALWRGNNAI